MMELAHLKDVHVILLCSSVVELVQAKAVGQSSNNWIASVN